MRLLIVEDNTEMRKTIRKVVATPKDIVMECSDGDEALSAYTSFHPDWVLMDYEMERIDGVTATADILQHDPSAKVMIVSQHNDIDVREAAEKAGAKKFISKQNIIELKNFFQQ